MSATAFLKELLAEAEPWRSCSAAVREEIAREARAVKFAVGETILSPRNKPENVFIVVSGRVRSLGLASLVCCQLETGRTHQIRIHLADGKKGLAKLKDLFSKVASN